MINWKTLTITMGAIAILPLSTYAATGNREISSTKETAAMSQTDLARRGRKGNHGNHGRKLDRLMSQLDLTSEQSQQIEAIQAESKSTSKNLKQQMRSQRQEMQSLMASDADTEEIRTQHQQVQQIHQQLSDNRLETMLRIREVLTSEQRSKIAELMAQHQERKSRN